MQAYADAVRSSSVILFFLLSSFLAENIVLEIKIMGEHHMTWSTVKLLGNADGAPCVWVGPLYYREIFSRVHSPSYRVTYPVFL